MPNALGHDKGIEPRLGRKLRRGHIPIDGTIDLHGLPPGRGPCRALPFHCGAACPRRPHLLLVITGMGLKKTGWGQIEQKAVLRSMLPIWLREKTLAPFVAGWQQAAREHGGEGAFYVRLKRKAP